MNDHELNRCLHTTLHSLPSHNTLHSLPSTTHVFTSYHLQYTPLIKLHTLTVLFTHINHRTTTLVPITLNYCSVTYDSPLGAIHSLLPLCILSSYLIPSNYAPAFYILLVCSLTNHSQCIPLTKFPLSNSHIIASIHYFH